MSLSAHIFWLGVSGEGVDCIACSTNAHPLKFELFNYVFLCRSVSFGCVCCISVVCLKLFTTMCWLATSLVYLYGVLVSVIVLFAIDFCYS